ncbi:MAG: radical SAM protein [Deltaproteobacteria bacterium]|nr:radical SAM protein [Deltaproteobacteria bacterium]
MPGTVFVRIGGPCNNHCAHCDAPETARPDAADLARMLAAAARRGFDRARLCGGEPTVRGDLPAVLGAAAKLGIEPVLHTNARVLATAGNAARIAGLGVREIEVRLYGPDAATHDAVVRAAAFEQTAAGVRNAVAAGIRVRAVAVACAGGYGRLDETVRVAIGLGAAEVAVRFLDAPLLPAARATEAIVAAIDRETGGRFPICCEGFPCCVVPSLKGREGMNPRRDPELRPTPDGIRWIEPRPAWRSRPLPCARCDLLGGCPTLPPGVVEAQGAGDLFPPALSLRGVTFRKQGALPGFALPACPYLADPSAARPPIDRLIRARADGTFDLYAMAGGVADPISLLQVKNARQAVRTSDGERLALDVTCRACLHLSRCAACFRDTGERHAPPAPTPARLVAAGIDADPLRWPDLDAGIAGFLRSAGDAPATLNAAAPFVLVEGDVPAAPGFDSGTMEPWVAWEAIRAAAPAVGLEDYALPIGRPGFELTFSEAAGPSRDGRLGTIFILKSCTMDCIICSVRRFYVQPCDPAMVPLPDVFRFMEEFRLLGFDRLDLFGGEPTMRPDLPDMLRFATRMGFYNDMITNGTLLTPALAAELRDAGLHLCMVSLDGPTEATHDVIRRTPGGYERAVAGIRAAVGAGGMAVSIDTVVLPENVDELVDLARFAVELGVTTLNLFLCLEGPISSPVPRLLGYDRAVRFYASDVPAIRAILEPAGVALSVAPAIPADRSALDFVRTQVFKDLCAGVYNPIWRRSDVVCKAPEQEIYLSLRGDVFPCTAPPILETDAKLGNVYKDSLIRIVRGRAASDFRKVAGHAEGCRMCWRATFDLSDPS